MPIFKNTYRKLDQDTAYNKVDPSSYYDCRNFRSVSNDASKSGALTVVKGNMPLTGSFSLNGYANDKVIGSVRLRNKMILFTTDDDTASPTTSAGRIWDAPLYNDAVKMENIILLYTGQLNFSRQNPIEDAASFYENDDIQKIYWTDNYNNLRYANVAKYLTSDGLVKSGSNSYLDPDEFNIVQKMDLSTPTVEEIINGNIPVGMVQYAYRLYKLNGPTSNFSPLSTMVPLSQSAVSLANTITFRGSDALNVDGTPLSSGKGLKIKIENIDTDYDRIEVVAVHYSTLTGTPKIYIIEVKPVSSTIYSIDDGTYTLGEYSLAEFTLINNPFRCKTLATKNNILFAGNITQSEFDFDFDARAYRYMKAGSIVSCKLYENDGGWWYNTSTNATMWVHYNSSGVSLSAVTGVANLPVDIDAINYYNQVLASNSYSYIYQSNGTTLGGEGPNVKYSFEALSGFTTVQRQIDGLGTSLNNTFGGNVAPAPNYYSSAAGPIINQQLRTFQRDEIYRVGMIGVDDKGRHSPTKWIGDIRIPDTYSSNFCNGSEGNMYSNPLQIKFEISNLPAEVKYVKIVYVKRDDKDKTIKAQGKINVINSYGNEAFVVRPKESQASDYNGLPSAAPDYMMKHILISSPDIAFYKNFNRGSNDYVEILGTCLANVQEPEAQFMTLKYHTYTYTSNRKVSVIDAKIYNTTLSPDDEQATPRAFGTLTIPFLTRVQYYNAPHTTRWIGNLGTCLMVQLSNYLNTSSITNGYMMVNYRTNLFGSQYGGNTFEDRTRNEYISAGALVSVTTGSATAYAKHGDTYIGYADMLTSYYNEFYRAFQNCHTLNVVEMFPVETSVNLDYTLDDSFHRIYNQSPACRYIREVGNATFEANDIEYSNNWRDMYLENTVYRRVADVKKYYPAALDYEPEYKNDTLVMASDMKEGLETIDAWTQWATNESISVDKNYGTLNKLMAWRNYLLYWQTDAVGNLAVLDRSLISDQEGKSTTLGEGTILQRHDVIATNMGLDTRFSIVASLDGIYWYDHKRRRVHRFLNNIEDLSTMRGVNSYFNSLSDDYAYWNNTISAVRNGKGFFMSYNPMYNEIWLTVKNTPSSGVSLIFNELLDAFTGFVDTKGYYFLTYDNKVFSIYDQYIYREDKGWPGHFYGTYYDSYVTVVVNPIPNTVLTFTNFEITSEVYDAVLSPIIPWGGLDSGGGVTPGDTGPITPPTINIPAVTTITPTYNNDLTATCGGVITNDGGGEIIEKGVCWNTTGYPPVYGTDSRTSNGSGTANFSSTLNGLVLDTLYAVRAYARNSVGIGYGETLSFNTYEVPVVYIYPVQEITDISVKVRIYMCLTGTDTDQTDPNNTATLGVCWSTSPTPTVSDDTMEYADVMMYTSQYPVITGLTPGTTYYLRAYGINSIGTSYSSDEICFTTETDFIGDATTTMVSAITTTTATSGGNIINDGGHAITDRGVCWNTSGTPTTADPHTHNGTGVGSFVSAITGLTEGTVYHVRSYGINSDGTFYGNEISFTTQSISVDNNLKDLDGNIYTTIQIDDLIWTKENLKVTKYADGVTIPTITDINDWINCRTGAISSYINDSSYDDTYGKYYNLYSITNARGLAYLTRNGVQESGWRIPTRDDFKSLLQYLDASYSEAYSTMQECWQGFSYVAGGPLKETGADHWLFPHTTGSNSTGFSARGAGKRLTGPSEMVAYFGNSAEFWSSTTLNPTWDTQINGYALRLWYAEAYAWLDNGGSGNVGLSVRLVKDV